MCFSIVQTTFQKMHLLTKPLRGTIIQHCLEGLRGHLGLRCQQSSVKMKIVKAPPINAQTYLVKNQELKRQLSPHLTIYRPQLTSMMSITLRLTGLAWGMMTWTVGWSSLIADQNVDYFVHQLQALNVNDLWWSCAKVVVVFPFSFHFVAGVRHLFFDTAKLMEIRQFYATGYMAIVLAGILAGLLGMLDKVPTVKSEQKEKKP